MEGTQHKQLLDDTSVLKRNPECLRLPRGRSGKESHLPMQEIQETWVQSLSQEDPLAEEMATSSGILTWETPRTEKSGRLQLQGGLQEPDTTENACMHTYTVWACMLGKVLFGQNIYVISETVRGASPTGVLGVHRAVQACPLHGCSL